MSRLNLMVMEHITYRALRGRGVINVFYDSVKAVNGEKCSISTEYPLRVEDAERIAEVIARECRRNAQVEEKEGSQRVLDVFYEKYLSPNMKMITAQARKFRDSLPDTEETVDEIVYKMIVNSESLSNTRYQLSFVYKIARNVCMQLAREQKYEKIALAERERIILTDADTQIGVLIKEEQLRLVGEAIETLSPRRKQIVELRLYHLPEKVADLFGTNSRTADVYYCIALGKIREYLNGKYPELFDENSKRVTKALSKTRGVLWGIDEKAYAIGLSSKGDSFVVVAEKVNSRFHNGIPVRNSGSVRNIILRIKKKKKRT